MSSELLSVQNLMIGFHQRKGVNEVVHSISFHADKGEILGIVGESGSGKSVTALSILRLLAAEGQVLGGEINFAGKNLNELTEEEMRRIRGNDISYVFQEPMTSLNPVLTIEYQLEEMLILHESLSKEQRHERMLTMLNEVGLNDGEQLLKKYPHQLSGGMRQRIMIAMAMICKPKLLIADEPTTALDVTIQAKILQLLKKLNQDYNTTIILISHDLSVVRSICDRVVVMYRGDVVEQGSMEEIFEHPQKDYTKKLLEAALLVHDLNHSEKPSENSIDEKKVVLDVNDLRVYYSEPRKKLFEKKHHKEVVKGVSYQVCRGEILGIVGESGCGKSTMAKAIVGLIKDTAGSITCSCNRPQMVFQDPYSSLNPSKQIGWLLEEPMVLAKQFNKSERKQRVLEMLKKVGLPEDYVTRYPSDLSGGQRQRVAIAMAIMLNQELIVLDEPVSSLDVTVQEQILTLLLELRKEYQLTYIFISHDMGVIRKMADRVGVMYQGELVELAQTEQLYEHPQHEYTKRLLEAVL